MAMVRKLTARPFRAMGLAAGLVAGIVAIALAQENFRVTFNVDRSTEGRTRVTGSVFNDNRADALDVYVTAEALDAGGKVVARGITFVSPNIRQGTAVAFDASVPAPSSASNFRVRVSAFRLGMGVQSP